ncbi:MAG: asparagine synthase-related protein [Candidatus Thermoplasmatota archaeon]
MRYPFLREAAALATAISAACAGIGECALGFSGGLDSSLLAHHLRDRCRGYVCGIPDAHDVRAAGAAADRIGIPLRIMEIDEGAVERLLGEIGRVAGTALSPTEAAILIPCTAVCIHAIEDTVVTGQGADELFGGYAKYLRTGEAGDMMRLDLQKVLQQGARRERLVATSCGKHAVHPYLSPEVIRAAHVQTEAHFWNRGRKMLLREAARCSGLPEALVEMPKKAAQYGSGAARLISRNAKREGLGVEAYVRRALNKK